MKLAGKVELIAQNLSVKLWQSISKPFTHRLPKTPHPTKKRWQHKGFSASFCLLKTDTFVVQTYQADDKSWSTIHNSTSLRAPIILIMSYIEKRIKRDFCAVFAVGSSSVPASWTSCSGSIARSQNSDTTHRVKKASNKGCNSILSHSPQNTTLNRGFSAVGFETAIGGAV